MVRLTAALISAIHDGADLATITSLIVPRRDFDQLMGLDVCERLTRLDLSDNRVSSLEGITLCTNLTWLSVAGNQLTSLKGVESLTKLTVLNASKNEITSMKEVAVLTELRALILNDNEITSVCRMDGLVNLNTVVLSRNPIRNLGNFASKLMSLKKLSMSHCQVQVIGTALKRCVTIEELRLAHNQLSTLPQEIERNGRLTILDLGTNHFKSWSDLQVLGTLHSLVNLNLRGNPICSQDGYEDEVRKRLPYLQVLDGDTLQEGPRKKKTKKAHNSTLQNDAKENETDSDHPLEASPKTSMKKLLEALPKTSTKKNVKDKTAEKGSADDSKAHSFLEMISLRSSATDEKSETKSVDEVLKTGKEGKRKVKKKKEDSGVVSVVDSTKGRHQLNRGKQVGELLNQVLSTAEIGTGGPSTWDDEPGPLTPVAITKADIAQEQSVTEHKPYSRWALKKKSDF